ncbi:hypothetical protein M9H77_30587 [Catharanthus roseus]|uniref:Uncharacterized protein n=1 Tax=Catharanthus roseus TaxID=4058 RepID=A0ACB9ZYQ5_CATRO|nr:hypothetical protein M9H77_30587 [Catharanthus roseus]
MEDIIVEAQTLRTTSRPLSYNNLKLPLLCGIFGPYDYEAWEQKVESLLYAYCVREEEKFQLVLNLFLMRVNIKSAQKRKKVSLRKVRVKENECFIGKKESEKEEQREEEIVLLEKSEGVNFNSNEASSFFASESLCAQNFEDPSKGEDGKLAYKCIKTINLFPSNPT